MLCGRWLSLRFLEPYGVGLRNLSIGLGGTSDYCDFLASGRRCGGHMIAVDVQWVVLERPLDSRCCFASGRLLVGAHSKTRHRRE